MKYLPLLAVIAGCGASTAPDLCAGTSGTCVNLTVTSATIAAVDALALTASGVVTGVRSSTTGRSARLPIRVPITLPAGLSGNLHLEIDGSVATHVVGHGSVDVAVVSGKHTSATAVLVAGAGAGDLGAPPDLAGSDGALGPGDAAMCSGPGCADAAMCAGAGCPDAAMCAGAGCPDLATNTPCTAADNHCSGDAQSLLTCSASGVGFDTTACPNGCSATSGAHCRVLVPTAPVAQVDFDTTGLADIAYAPNIYFLNSDDGTIIGPGPGGALSQTTRMHNDVATTYQVISQIGFHVSGGVGIFTFKSLNIQEGTEFRLTGGNPVALVSAGDLKINGVVEARPMNTSATVCPVPPALVGGPGGGVGGAGGTGGPNYFSGMPGAGQGPGGGGFTKASGGSAGFGGGGGGHADTGGLGNGGLTAAGGVAYDVPELTGFHGGSGGGGGGLNPNATGGGGGGAVQLVSLTKVAIGNGGSAGGVNAGGCAGGAIGGGGSGGSILVEAPVVQLGAFGVLAANGGSSGGANGGLDDTIPAGASNGGAGGAKDKLVGTAGTSNAGGGGAAGRIRINTASAMPTTINGFILSPSVASTGTTLGTSVQ